MISFIGIGNMGGSMIKRLATSGMFEKKEIGLFDLNVEVADSISKELGVVKFDSANTLVGASDIVILAVKPNVAEKVLVQIKDDFAADNRKIFVSIAAGLTVSFYENILGDKCKIVRTMPNMPAQVGEGMTLLCANEAVSKEELENMRNIFECFGKAAIIEEKMMNPVIALTSSSPAYVFMFIEAMADAAVLSGIPRNMAYEMAAQAVVGSAKLLLETGQHPGVLKDAICSPGGTTIEAVAALEQKGFRDAVISAMNACTEKAEKMSK